MIIDRIKSLINSGTVIPKPEAIGPFVVKGWGMRRGQSAMVYRIPNHKDSKKPYEKGITEEEFIVSYIQLKEHGELTKAWFSKVLPECVKEGGCNFTTVGGIFVLLGEARYSRRGVCSRII